MMRSRDHQRLPLHGPLSQGEGDLGFGRLWCLQLKDGALERIADADVTRAEWSGTRRVRYWTGTHVPDARGGDRLLLEEKAHHHTAR